MQLGTESRKKTIAAIGLMVVALVFVALRFFPDSPAAAKSPAPAVAPQPASRRNVAVTRGTARKAVVSTESSLDPSLRYDWLKASEDVKYQGTGRNIFRAQIDIPKPVVPVHVATAPAIPQGPPPPPPINLK